MPRGSQQKQENARSVSFECKSCFLKHLDKQRRIVFTAVSGTVYSVTTRVSQLRERGQGRKWSRAACSFFPVASVMLTRGKGLIGVGSNARSHTRTVTPGVRRVDTMFAEKRSRRNEISLQSAERRKRRWCVIDCLNERVRTERAAGHLIIICMLG